MVRQYPAPVQLIAPFSGTVVATAAPGAPLAAGEPVVVLEAMKMEHEVVAETPGTVTALHVAVGDTVDEGQPVAELAGGAGEPSMAPSSGPTDPEWREDLDAVLARHALTLDAARPDAVAKRHEAGQSHRAGEPGRSRRPRHVRRVRTARVRRPGGPAPAAGARRANAGGRAGRRRRATSRAIRPSSCPTTTPCSPAPRGGATTPRRTGCSRSPTAGDCRSSCSPRAAAGARATSICRSSPASTAARSPCSPS